MTHPVVQLAGDPGAPLGHRRPLGACALAAQALREVFQARRWAR